jgi:hypothetical protein
LHVRHLADGDFDVSAAAVPIYYDEWIIFSNIDGFFDVSYFSLFLEKFLWWFFRRNTICAAVLIRLLEEFSWNCEQIGIVYLIWYFRDVFSSFVLIIAYGYVNNWNFCCVFWWWNFFLSTYPVRKSESSTFYFWVLFLSPFSFLPQLIVFAIKGHWFGLYSQYFLLLRNYVIVFVASFGIKMEEVVYMFTDVKFQWSDSIFLLCCFHLALLSIAGWSVSAKVAIWCCIGVFLLYYSLFFTNEIATCCYWGKSTLKHFVL